MLPFDYAVRNLGRSTLRLALGFGGSVLVVLLVIGAAAFLRGMGQSLAITGGERNVILLGSGSEESVERSEIAYRAAGIAAASIKGVRERLGEAYVSPEIHVALTAGFGEETPGSNLVVVRGVQPSAFLVHARVHITQGRMPIPGRDEILVGGLVATKLGVDRVGVGDRVRIDDRSWTVSGTFRAPQTVMDAEIWMPLADLQVVAQRDNLSCVVLTLESEDFFEDVDAFAAERLDLELTSIPEREYYAALSEFFGPVRLMVIVTAALIAIGGILGGINTMYAAFASRVRELGTLQVLGFTRTAVVVSIVQEAILTTSAGAIAAAMIGMIWLDRVAVQFSMGAFGLVVDAPVIVTGLVAGVLLGCLGALPPTVRCLRLSVHEALKA